MGGIERVTLVVAEMLAKEGCDVTIMCLQKAPPYFQISENIEVVYLTDLEGKNRTERLKNWAVQNKPTVAIVSGTNRPLFILNALKTYPIIAWEHVNINIQSHPLHNLYRYYYSKKACIVTLTEDDANAWRRKFPRAKVVCIPNPLTLPIDRPSNLESKKILSIGRHAGQKGFDRLVKAWYLIEKEFPDWKLRIVGSGRKKELLKRQMKKLGITERIELIRATPEVTKEYQNASVYALSSRYEGFGLVLVEAMHFGLPIVSFDCPYGPREIVAHGKSGILVPNGDIIEFANALRKVLSNPNLKREMSCNALERVKQYYPENITPQWISLIQSICEKHM